MNPGNKAKIAQTRFTTLVGAAALTAGVAAAVATSPAQAAASSSINANKAANVDNEQHVPARKWR